jgi:hypothetical protein
MIKHLKKFEQFINERYEINNLPKNIYLLSNDDNNTFLLYDILLKEAIGYIGFGLYPLINSFTVGGAYSKHGYGAFLYECAMTFVYPNGLSMSRDSNTSYDALDVWDKFNKRKDVKKERINSDEITHKKRDYPNGGMFDDNQSEMQRIFDLEDTRFYYSFGKDKLNNLIENGKKYILDNNISNDDIRYMTWDLE